MARYQHALGEAYQMLGKSDAALDCCSAALRLDPNLAQAENARGQILFDRSDWLGAAAATVWDCG